MMKLEDFKSVDTLWADSRVCGIYKIVSNTQGEWFAYFKPNGWVDFGNSCEIIPDMGYRKTKSATYPTPEEAVAACNRHFKAYPTNPEAWNKLLV